MDSIDLLRDNLHKSTQRVLEKIEDMRDHALVPPTPNGGAHTLWVLGHLAFIEGQVVHHFLQGQPNPMAHWEDPFDGADVPAEPDRYPPFAEVLATCRDMRARTLALLDTLTEDDLDRTAAACPKGWEETFGTYRLCLQMVSDHWYMHRGQLADARRAADLDRMWV